jgi:hypothetical protein
MRNALRPSGKIPATPEEGCFHLETSTGCLVFAGRIDLSEVEQGSNQCDCWGDLEKVLLVGFFYERFRVTPSSLVTHWYLETDFTL